MCLISGLTPNLRMLLFSSFKCHWELYKISLFHSACAPMWVYIYILKFLFHSSGPSRQPKQRGPAPFSPIKYIIKGKSPKCASLREYYPFEKRCVGKKDGLGIMGCAHKRNAFDVCKRGNYMGKCIGKSLTVWHAVSFRTRVDCW